MMDDILKSNVTSDAKANRRKRICGAIDSTASQGEDDARNEFTNPSHGSQDNNIGELLKVFLQSDKSEESLSEEIAATALQYEQENSVKPGYKSKSSDTNEQINANEADNSKTNGCLTMDEQSLAINMSKQSNKGGTHSRNSSSDEDFEERKALSHISESFSGELNTNGFDSSARKNDVCNSSSRREHTVAGSSELQSLSRVSERPEQSKKKISFRALVRMKGLGRKLRKKHQGKSKQKHQNNKTDCCAKDPLMFSDSSAKYLLESSTSVTDEHPQHKTIEHDSHPRNKKSNSFSGTSIFQSVDSSSSENLCPSNYLEKRRFAVCEELEKTILCSAEQNLAELRSILVIQNKLTGFGLL